MTTEVKIFFVKCLLFIGSSFIAVKLATDLSWSWWKVTSPFWIGIPLIGLIDGFIDVYKFYKK